MIQLASDDFPSENRIATKGIVCSCVSFEGKGLAIFSLNQML